MAATHRNPYALMLDRSAEIHFLHTLLNLGHDSWAFFLKRCAFVCSQGLYSFFVKYFVLILPGTQGGSQIAFTDSYSQKST